MLPSNPINAGLISIINFFFKILAHNLKRKFVHLYVKFRAYKITLILNLENL